MNSSEYAPGAEDGDKYAKFMVRRDRALATTVLSVDPALLYSLLTQPYSTLC